MHAADNIDAHPDATVAIRDRFMPTDARVIRTRRHGQRLHRAVYEATVAELIATGYCGLTMDGIAARACCGKGTLYRYWPGKRELVLAALRSQFPQLPAPRPQFSPRKNLLAVLSSLADVLSGKTSYPSLSVIGQLLHDHELRAAYADMVVAPQSRVINEIIVAGVSSGEINPKTVTTLTAQTGPALIILHLQLCGRPPTKVELEQITDTVIARPRRRSRHLE